MSKKTEQQRLRETEPPQLGKDLEFNKDGSKMDLPGCTYLIPLRVESPDSCLLYTSPSPRDRG